VAVTTGRIGPLLGIPIVSNPCLLDGEMHLFTDPGTGRRTLLLGTRPHPPRAQAQRDAVRIVREGLADVLAWLTDPPEPSLPYRTSGEILVSLRSGSVTHSTVGSASL
jgi:hypothetical protein